METAASAVTPLSEMTDEELDARIRQLAANHNFDSGDELDAQFADWPKRSTLSWTPSKWNWLVRIERERV